MRNILFLISLLVITPLNTLSQEVLDNAQYRAVYYFSYKTKPDQTEFAKTDLMYLDIGQKVTKFYSRYEEIRDSVQVVGLNANLPVFEINEQKRGYKRGVSRINYHFLSEHKFTVTDRFAFYFALYEEPEEMPKWNITNEEMQFAGFTCQKATATYLGREWTTYFTKEIPINQGPWKLWGLEGLILFAKDKEGFFEFQLQGFEKLNAPTPIVFIGKNYNNKKYDKQDKTAFRKMEKLYYDDNNEFMKLYLGASSITITRPDGTQRTGTLTIPYIPLEPW